MPQEQSHEHIVRSAGIVSAAVLLSRVSGLVRETVMAHLFGAGRVFDAFSLGFRIPNLTRDLFAEGALSSAFVPTFTEYLSKKNRQEAAQLANLVGTAVILIVGAVCALGVVFSPAIVGALASGWAQADAGKFQLAVHLTRIMFPFLLVVALAAQAMGVLNACNKFGVPALASSMFNVGSVLFGVALGYGLGPRLGIDRIEGMAYGVVLGGVLQLVWQLPSLRRSGFSFRPRIDWSHPGLRQILRLMAPAIIGSAAVQINVLVNTNFASKIVDPVRGLDGPVAWLQYAFRFMQLPLGLFGVAIASATLPAISLSAASGRIEEFRRTLSRSLGLVLLLTLPSSAGLLILGEPMIGVIYEGRRFQPYDTHQTAVALSFYAIGLAGYSALKVLVPAFYALGNAKIPMIVSAASIGINYLAAWGLTRREHMGQAGLALATSAVAVFGSATLFWILRARLGGIHGRALLANVAKICCACAVMAGAVALASHGMENWLGVSRFARLANLAVSIPLGILVFYTCCRAAKVVELEEAGRLLGSPFTRWKGDGVIKLKKQWSQT
jgi:putative peptidoglycan lipid II flippase